MRRFFATQPERPSPNFTVALRSCAASTPEAKRHLSESVPFIRNSALPDHGMMLISFDEMSAIVSATPRLVPIDCAISYSA